MHILLVSQVQVKTAKSYDHHHPESHETGHKKMMSNRSSTGYPSLTLFEYVSKKILFIIRE